MWQEQGKIEFIPQGAVGGDLWRLCECLLDFGVQASLECCDARVKVQPFGGKGIQGSQFTRATDTAIPFRMGHCLGWDLPVAS